MALMRAALQLPRVCARPAAQRLPVLRPVLPKFAARSLATEATQEEHKGSHDHNESYEDFNSRYARFFESVDDLFELQRGLNNCFAYDLVPSQQVVEAALKASRRVNDYSTAVRIFEGLKEKVENKTQYQQYLDATASLRKELGVETSGFFLSA